MGSSPANPSEQTMALMARKDNIQTEMDAQFSILSANSSTMNTPLVDPQGFPRADIDVFAVRHARVRIIELKNDMNAVMDEIAKALENLHSQPQALAPLAAPVSESEAETTSVNNANLKPFARVDGVAPGSPAWDAVSSCNALRTHD